MELEITTKLTKQTIASCLLRIKIDHSISISLKDFNAKVDLLFEDCKNLTNEQFIYACEQIRQTELYGKIPPSIAFLNLYKPEKTLAETINKMAGGSYLTAITIVGNKAMLHFKSVEDYDTLRSLKDIQEIKCKISSELRTDGFEIDIRS